jgi:uncharacterized membrane protein
MGNIVTGIFWKAHADRTRDLQLIAHTLDGIIRSDRMFTMPGIVAIIVGGFGAAIVGGLPILRTGWIFWSIVLFILSGIAYSARVAPLQRKLAALAHARVGNSQFDWALYHALSRQWELWGLFAILAPSGAVALMVLKPAIRGL